MGDNQMTNQIPAVSERNTKKEILAALEVAEQLLAKKSEGTFNPTAIAKVKENEAAITVAENADVELESEFIASAQNQIVQILSDALAQHTSTVKDYTSIKNAIEIKQAELKELFDIEVKAGTLAALIQAHADVTEKQKAEFEAKHAEFKAELDRLDEIAKDNRRLVKETKDELEADLKKEFLRKREEAEYEFNRERQQRHDTLNDELAAKRKTFIEEVNALEKRVEEVIEREAKVEALEEQVAAIPALLEDAVAKAASEAEFKAKTAYGFESRALKANYEADTKILTNKVEVLEEALRNERAANEALQAKLETAYASVENVAKASVEGARTENAVNRVLSTINEGKK